MGTGGNDCIGLAPDGVTDAVAICQDAPDPTPRASRPPGPACVIMPQMPGELPLAGDGAFESLDGRGWDPHHARARQPILPLLLGLEGSAGTGAEEAGHWLAAHLRALGGAPGARHIVAVPDCLGELGQQRLLDALRRANIPAELLWRPIATVLGWACRQSPAQIEALHGKSVLVMHLGFWAPELSLVRLEAEEHQGRRWLIPIRDGRGLALPAGLAWPIASAAIELMTADLARVGLSLADVDPSLVWLSRRPWAALCGAPLPEEIIRDRKGCWYRLGGVLDPPAAVTARLADPIRDLLHRQAANPAQAQVHRVLIDGPLTRLNVGPMSFGDQLTERLRQLGMASTDIDVLPVQLSAIASGAAHYGWRRRKDIPGYYDTVPDLRINALKELRPAFISLLPGQQRVAGGQRLGPVEVPGFAIAAGTEALDYHLTRSDEPTVRLTRTKLPERPDTTTPVKLIVTQMPGQGFASVEIRPLSTGSLGARTVFLDWNTMTDTGKSPAEVLRELSENSLAYPDPTPFPCHAAVWESCSVASAIAALVDSLRSSLKDTENVAEHCMKAVSAKRSLDWLLKKKPGGVDKAGAFDSDGNAPSEASLCAHAGPPPFPYSDYRMLIDDLRHECGLAFAKLRKSPGYGGDLHRRLLLIAGWYYADAPVEVLGYVRHALRTGKTAFNRYDFNVAGRCFTQPDDIRLLFAKVRKDFEQQGLDTPFDRTKALSLVLAYRADAPFAINLNDAFILAGKAVNILEREQRAVEEGQKKKLAATFFAAVFLLTGLLRCRRVDADFLGSAKPATQKLVMRVRDILDRAVKTSSGNLQSQLKDLCDQIPAFLEAKGTDALIFKRLDELSD